MTMTHDETTADKSLDSIRIWISAESTGDAARVRWKLDSAGLVASLTRAEMTSALDDAHDAETAAIWALLEADLLVHAGRPDPVELAFAEGFGLPVMHLSV
jgi:hypothetical protein